MPIVRRLARPLLAAVFVSGGADALRRPGARVAQATPLASALAERTGRPIDAAGLVRANGATMVVAGLMLATGRAPRVAGGLLAAALLPSTVTGHPFWREPDPVVRKQEAIQFQKNLALLGGLLLAAVDTAGKPGLPWRARNAARGATRSARRETRLAAAEARLALS